MATRWEGLDGATRAISLLDSDFCRIINPDGEIERYIRSVLMLPVLEIEAEFQLVVWVSVSERSRDIYSAGYGIGEYQAKGCFGYLANAVSDFERAAGLHANVWFQPDSFRPLIDLHDGDHPLIAAQKSGIGVQQVEQWAAGMHQVGLTD